MPQNHNLQVAFGASISVGLLSSKASYRIEEPRRLPSHWNTLKGSCGSYQIVQKILGYVLLLHFVQATLIADASTKLLLHLQRWVCYNLLVLILQNFHYNRSDHIIIYLLKIQLKSNIAPMLHKKCVRVHLFFSMKNSNN